MLVYGSKAGVQRAANAAGLGHLAHTFRQLTAVAGRWGDHIGVQQKLMRHADIRTTMNVYGDALTAEMVEAHGKIVGLALNGTGNGNEACLKY